jgi:hypothetical protein
MRSALFFLPLAAAVDRRGATVDKVVELLTELKGKVQSDLRAETVLMEEYNTWCDHEKQSSESEIKSLEATIATEQGKQATEKAKQEKAAADIVDFTGQIESNNAKIKASKEKRVADHKAYNGVQISLVTDESSLRRAADVLKRIQSGKDIDNSFAQSGFDQLSAISRALTTIETSRSTELKSLIEAAPQAAISSYDKKSGVILKMVEKLRNEVAEELRKVEKEEIVSRQAHESEVQALTNFNTDLADDVASAKSDEAAATAAFGEAQKNEEQAQENLAAEKEYHANTQAECTDTRAVWAARQKSAADEMEAIQKAVTKLQTGVIVDTALVQVASRTRISIDDADKRDQIVTLLRTLGRRFSSFGLLQAANAASEDPFGQVRELIQSMIVKLQQQAAAEKTAFEECDTQLKTLKQEVKQTTHTVEKKADRIATLTARLETLAASTETEKANIADLQEAQKEANAMRKEQNTNNLQTIQDNKDSAAAVAEAIKILNEFYAEQPKALLQQDPKRPAVPKFQEKKGDAGSTIIAILEVAQSDMEKLVADTTQAEADQVKAHNTFTLDTTNAIETKQAQIQMWGAETASKGTNKQKTQGEHDSKSDQLSNAKEQLSKWEQKCASNSMSYAERKQRRLAEIDGLKEALEILSADDAAPAFLQKRSDRY